MVPDRHPAAGAGTGGRPTVSTLVRLCERLSRLCEDIATGLLAIVVVVNGAQVFYRYGLGDPLGWTEEVMRYSVVWVTFLASATAVWRGEHMTIEMLTMFVSPRVRHAIDVLVLLCIAAFCLVLVWKGAPLAWRNAAQTSPSAEIPMIVPYGAVAVGGALMLLKAVALLVTGVRPQAEGSTPVASA